MLLRWVSRALTAFRCSLSASIKGNTGAVLPKYHHLSTGQEFVVPTFGFLDSVSDAAGFLGGFPASISSAHSTHMGVPWWCNIVGDPQ